jgi:alpha-D-xyloside xylohydrolase
MLVVTLAACGDDGGNVAPDDTSDTADADAGADTLDDATADTIPDGSGQPDAELDGSAVDATPDTTPDPPVTLGGDYSVTVDPAGPVLVLSRRDETLLTLGADGVAIGVLATMRDNDNYDPFGFVWDPDPFVHKDGPIDEWLDWKSVDVISSGDGAAEFLVTFAPGQTATLTLSYVDEHRFVAHLTPEDSASNVVYFRLRPQVDVSEAYYGLGEFFDTVNQRGMVRAMQLELQAELESSYNEAHVPIPFFTGTRGWGLFVESYSPGVFDMASHADDRLDIIFGTGPDSLDGLRVHLFVDEHPLDITRHYYDVTGYPIAPAPWALGPWIWRDENDDQAQVLNDIQTIRDLDLATTAMWIDRPYATGVNTFDFDVDKFPDPQVMIDQMHDLGFRVALWHTPYLDDSDPATLAQREEAEGSGYYPPQTGLLLNGWGKPVDLSNPDAFEWWQSQIQRYIDMGIEGFKLDYGEDIVPGAFGARNIWRFFDGTTERTMHRRFALLYHAAYAELLPETGGFLLCRAGTWGDQTRASVIWPGDLDADMVAHGEEATNRDGETYTAVGGLEASLVAALSLGPSGFPLFGSDTGGYRHSPPDRETFVRWFELTAFSTVMQVGTSTNDVAWEFNELNGFDDESLDWYREYARLHLRLWPYLWTYFNRISWEGRPIQRALGLAYPELGVHPSDQYLLGDNIFVAPVLHRDERSRDAYLPPGAWVDWWTGQEYEGEPEVTFDAPLGVIPVLLRRGGIVPMLRPTIDAMAPTTQPELVDSFATDPGRLYLLAATGDADETFTVYDGTEIQMSAGGAVSTLRYNPGSVFDQGAVFELIAESAPASIVRLVDLPLEQYDTLAELEAAGSGWAYTSERGGTLWIAVPEGGEISIER